MPDTLWWVCPNCGAKVNFKKQMYEPTDVFDEETGMANFDPCDGGGLWLHTIECPNCSATWSTHILGIAISKEEE